MTPRNAVLLGDCVERLRELDADSVDAIVCDPPYGLEFMGKEWDSFKTGRSANYAKGGQLNIEAIKQRRGKGGAGPSYTNRPAKRCANCGKQAWSGSPCQCAEPVWEIDNSPLHAFQAWTEAWAREALRVLKPGGHLLAFGGTRTYHRLVSGLEDAGFEIRDTIAWIYGSGFPKSLDVSKAIDEAAGHWRGRADVASANGAMSGPNYERTPKGPPYTDAARTWSGFGTALKPAHELIVVARKPLVGTVAANVERYGTGALNIDGCRVEADEDYTELRVTQGGVDGGGYDIGTVGRKRHTEFKPSYGRWPANVAHDGSLEVLELFPQEREASAARFFYCAKASRADREAGLVGLPERSRTSAEFGGESGRPGRTRVDGEWVNTDNPRQNRQNDHPTVKPHELMRWLCRLVGGQPGSLILDPFAGSGSTLRAAQAEGFDFLGIERDRHYYRLACLRAGLPDPGGVAE